MASVTVRTAASVLAALTLTACGPTAQASGADTTGAAINDCIHLVVDPPGSPKCIVRPHAEDPQVDIDTTVELAAADDNLLAVLITRPSGKTSDRAIAATYDACWEILARLQVDTCLVTGGAEAGTTYEYGGAQSAPPRVHATT